MNECLGENKGSEAAERRDNSLPRQGTNMSSTFVTLRRVRVDVISVNAVLGCANSHEHTLSESFQFPSPWKVVNDPADLNKGGPSGSLNCDYVFCGGY